MMVKAYNATTGDYEIIEIEDVSFEQPAPAPTTEDRIAALEEELAFMTAAYTAGVNDA